MSVPPVPDRNLPTAFSGLPIRDASFYKVRTR